MFLAVFGRLLYMYFTALSTDPMGHWMASPLRLFNGEAVPGTKDGRPNTTVRTDGRPKPPVGADGRSTCGTSDERPVGLTGGVVKKWTVELIDQQPSAQCSGVFVRDTEGESSFSTGQRRGASVSEPRGANGRQPSTVCVSV